MPDPKPDYGKLSELLANETYPHRYMHKFIGVNCPEFTAAVAAFKAARPKLKLLSARESAGSGQAYIAYTYEILADSADEIIELLKSTSQLPHLKIML